MINSIHKVYQNILPKFEEYLQDMANRDEPLCILSKANFKPGQLPDYKEKTHIWLYLMRYGLAYVSEYYLVFKQILGGNYLMRDKLSILSLGSGANLDGLAACIAIKDSGIKRRFIYHGIDKVKWPIVLTVPKYFHLINKDLTEFAVSDLQKGSAINVISFPKILSEISIDNVEIFFNSGIASYLENKIILIFSNRRAANSADYRDEISKSIKIVDFITSQPFNYSVYGEFHISGKDDKYKGVHLHKLDDLPFNEKPIGQDIIKICDDPGFFCCHKDNCPKREYYDSEFSGYTTRCRENIGRYPILKASYFDSHLYFLEKK